MIMRPTRTRNGVLAAAWVLATVAAPAWALAADTDPTDVRVERVRPESEKHPTMQFLKENIDFIRGRFDRLRETPLTRRGDAAAMDPRFLEYQSLLARVNAASDSVRVLDDRQSRQTLFQSVTQLGALEADLDQLQRQLADQRARLAALQADFTGTQQTALMVVVSGYSDAVALDRLTLTLDDGDTLAVPLGDEARETLRRGGVVQALYRLVEPRAQVLELSLAGAQIPSSDRGFIALEPERDRITMLRLDLSAVRSDQGSASVHASRWLHEDGTPTRGS
jgi:hypothetical protein